MIEQVGAPVLADLVERRSAGVRSLDRDDLLQRLELGPRRSDLRGLASVLAEDDAGARIAEDEGALDGRARRVDRHDDAPDRGKRGVAESPLEPGAGKDREAGALAG